MMGLAKSVSGLGAMGVGGPSLEGGEMGLGEPVLGGRAIGLREAVLGRETASRRMVDAGDRLRSGGTNGKGGVAGKWEGIVWAPGAANAGNDRFLGWTTVVTFFKRNSLPSGLYSRHPLLDNRFARSFEVNFARGVFGST